VTRKHKSGRGMVVEFDAGVQKLVETQQQAHEGGRGRARTWRRANADQPVGAQPPEHHGPSAGAVRHGDDEFDYVTRVLLQAPCE